MLTDFSNCKIKKWQRHGDLVILNYDFLEKHRIDGMKTFYNINLIN